MSNMLPHILGAIGETLVLTGGLIPLVELLDRGKHSNNIWLIHQWISKAKKPGFIQLHGCEPVFAIPGDQKHLMVLASRCDQNCRRLAHRAAGLMVVGGLCLIAYHWLSLD